MPGASRSSSGLIAYRNGEYIARRIDGGRTSGVRSRTPKPVPPVVTIQSATPRSAHSRTVARIWVSSSGTIWLSVHS